MPTTTVITLEMVQVRLEEVIENHHSKNLGGGGVVLSWERTVGEIG